MRRLAKRWRLGTAVLIVAVAAAVAATQAFDGSDDQAQARTGGVPGAAEGLGQLSGRLPRKNLTLESAIKVDLSRNTVRLPLYKGKVGNDAQSK